MTRNACHEGFEKRMVGILRIHDKANGSIEAGDQQKAVHEGDMIGHQQRPAGCRYMGLADDAEAIERIGEQ